jgi:hypothetical protein
MITAPGGSVPNAPARQSDEAASTGMSTRMKIGIGAAALLGCYELGYFSRSKPAAPGKSTLSVA